ncbi:MAG: hypothetical protein ACKVQU_04160 [Burkholderiales bacterium]
MRVLARFVVIACFAFGGAARSADLTFGVFGDTPYSALEEIAFPDLISQMSAERLAFVVHIGDFKSGSSPCTDELFLLRHTQLQRSKHPLLFLPADNEWTDCHRVGAGRMDPLERLDKLRALFHSGDSTLGERTMPLKRQSSDARFSAYRENVRWMMGDVVFAALNVTGSNNNWDRTSAMDDEHHARMAANEVWLEEAVRMAIAGRSRALVIFFHANPMFDRDADPPSRRDGFLRWRAMLADAARRFDRPILLIHGDSHHHRIDHPLRIPGRDATFPNVTRLEVFGAPVSNWSRVTISGDAPATFRIEAGRKMESGGP